MIAPLSYWSAPEKTADLNGMKSKSDNLLSCHRSISDWKVTGRQKPGEKLVHILKVKLDIW